MMMYVIAREYPHYYDRARTSTSNSTTFSYGYNGPLICSIMFLIFKGRKSSYILINNYFCLFLNSNSVFTPPPFVPLSMEDLQKANAMIHKSLPSLIDQI